MKNYCTKCMNELEGSPVCRFCGRDNSKPPVVEPYHLKPGTLLCGKYLVGEAIGEGGFGITYIGLHTTLSKRVAIKEFYPSGAANRTSDVSEEVIITRDKQMFFRNGVERFLQEAKNIASFPDEDGIVDVLDYFQENNTAYIVMEYLDGLTLKEYTEKYGLFDCEKLIEIMRPMIKSLGVIHSRGVIHRDISPDNIMYNKNGKLKLMDFGSARYFTNEDRQMSVILKQGFAPEEQYRSNGKQGPYTDIYALCATIYTCITGRVPESSLDRLSQDNLLPPSRLGVPIKPYMENALMHGLAVRAAYRTPDVDTLLREMTAPQPQAAPYMQNQPVNPNQNVVPPVTMNPTGYTTANNSKFYANNHTPMRNQTAWQQQNTGSGQNYANTNGGQRNYPSQNRGQQTFTNQNQQRKYTSPKKSPLPLVLGIVISITLLVAAAVVLIIIFSGVFKGSGGSASSYPSVVISSSAVEPSSRAESSKASSSKAESSKKESSRAESSKTESSKTESSKTESSRAESSKAESSKTESSKTASASVSGFSAEDAAKYSDQIISCIQPKIFEKDDMAKPDDKIEIQNMYYVSKNDGSYDRIVFVYYNSTSRYYRTIMIAPEFLELSDGGVNYASSYIAVYDADASKQKAIESNWLLNSKSGNFTATDIL